MDIDYKAWQPAETDIYTDPFPHIICDNILPPDLITEINKNWPEPGIFQQEVPGNYVLYLTPENQLKIKNEKKKFWQMFLDNSYIPLCQSIAKLYSPIVERRYSESFEDILFASICLMESEANYPGHPLHTHYYHDPTWLCTNFIYVDDEDINARGTTLHGLGDDSSIDRKAHISAHSFKWEEAPEMKKIWEIAFQPNRLLSFTDGPISFHSVENHNPISKPLPRRGRRLIRSHIQLDPSKFIPPLYGISVEEYRKAFLHLNIVNGYHTKMGYDIVEWVKKDIVEIYTDPVFSLTSRATLSL